MNIFLSSAIAFLLVGCGKEPVTESSTDTTILASNELVSIDQTSLNALAKNLEVKYRFLSNIETDCPDLKGEKVAHCYSAEIALTNATDRLVTDWQLNFSQVYVAYASESEQLTLTHINGDIHQITPTKAFEGFKIGETQKIKLWVKSTLISESELMPNYWLAAKNLMPAVIKSTRTQIDSETGLEIQPYVVSFDDVDKQIKSAPDDVNEYASAQWLFEQNADVKIQTSHLPFAVIPTPQKMEILDDTFRLDLSQGLNVSYKSLVSADVEAAFERLATLGIKKNIEGFPLIIEIKASTKGVVGSYSLTTTKEAVTITASERSGAFYGVQTLAGLLTLPELTVPLVKIVDQPRYQYRGQHLDVARNFHDKEMVFTLIEQMAAYKLNKLHLHLAEDEGWRLALPSFPELTQLGSTRCMDLSDKKCLQPQLGGAQSKDRDGYYSVEDYQEILMLAAKNYIQVIPSLDMPGHSRAAIKAMEARYQHYMEQENEAEATRYLLSDFDDKTQYSSIQNYNDNTINICMESSYQFVDRVLEDLITMHEQANHPLEMYHIGADETAGAWVDSPVCQALIDNENNNVKDAKHLGAHFIERVSHMIDSKGIAVGGWNDGLGETTTSSMPKNVYSYIWGALPWGAHQQVSEQASRNWNVILSTPDVFYFDFPYEIDPKERGYHWASRRVNSRSIYNFMPDNLPVHADFRVDTLGKSFVSDDRLQKDETGKILHQPLPQNFKVAGIQGQLWSETIRSEEQAEYMIYPRLLTLAERAWHTPNWQVDYNYQGVKYDRNSGVFTLQQKQERDRQWQRFSNSLSQKELMKLDKAQVFYRVPTVGAKVIEGKLHMNSSLVGLPLEYRVANQKWQRYKAPIAISLPVEVRAKTLDSQRSGRSLFIKN
jgi:hexosaminidase